MAFDTRDKKAVTGLAAAQKDGNVIGLAAVTGDVLARRDIDDLLFNDEDKMVELVQEWLPETERATQLNAARRFRLPYWDYWKPRGGPVTFPGVRNGGQTSFDYDFRIPDIFVAKKVMVRKPKGTKLDPIDNPLVSFKFPEKKSDAAWGNYWESVTSRYPGVNKPVTAMNYQLNMAREGSNTFFISMVKDPAYKYYADVGTNAINTFGGGSKGSSADPKGSLESIHNNYHGRIGGGGQMSDPSVAAFDPVFWIHHCQIDRLLAIWQATHPNSWFDGNGSKDAEKGLLPFTFPNEAGKGDWWDSNKVKKPDVFGYTYGDIDQGKTADAVKQRIVDRYSWATQSRITGEPPRSMDILPIFEQAQVFNYDGPTKDLLIAESAKTGALDAALKQSTTKQVARIAITQPMIKPETLSKRAVTSQTPIVEDRVLPKLTPSDLVITNPEEVKGADVEWTWYVDNVVERLALNGTFTIYFFIGAPDDRDEAKYLVQPTLAGITHNFAAPVEYCDNCGQQAEQGQLVSGTVVITPILKDYVLANELADLTLENVRPFLVKHLKWRVVTVDGQRVDPRFIPGLTLGVSSKITGPEAGQIRYQEHNDIIAEILQNSS
ncbi:MAG: hypothetical protein Q9227_002338 [Pyrenula ochraceoflavens]